MSKGFKPTEKNRPPVSTIDVGGSGGSGSEDVEVKSWQFALVDKTAFASLARVGTPVTGIVSGADIMVKNGKHYYGFAPSHIASEIIEAMNGQGKLSGTITSVNANSNDSNEPDVWVKLFLR
ncbi:MAG TPA: hypothetical protein VF648_16705 [Pyrinomonadaceae bacterium]